jgi:hypothetical protein
MRRMPRSHGPVHEGCGRRQTDHHAGLRSRLTKTVVATALVAGGFVAPALISPPPAHALDPTTFYYTGGEQQFSVPTGYTTVMVTAVGGKGGTASTGASAGWGASVTATVDLPAGTTTLYVEVGGNAGTGSAAGWNGGGASGSTSAGAGGGASDVRTTSLTTALNTTDTRIVVAGGGGGSGRTAEYCPSLPGGSGGNAGVSTASGAGNGGDGDYGTSCTTTRVYDGAPGGLGSPAGTGGFYSGSPGALGQGGNGGGVNGAGGGGGYYGGGGGGAGNYVGGGGGGGSSYWPSGAASASLSTDSSGVPSITITPILTAPTAPTDVVASKTARGAVSLTWTDHGFGITSHTIEVYTYKKGNRKTAATYTYVDTYSSGAQSSWEMTGMPRGVYVFRVSATNTAGTSPLSESNAVRL